jgi:hypothetical protein
VPGDTDRLIKSAREASFDLQQEMNRMARLLEDTRRDLLEATQPDRPPVCRACGGLRQVVLLAYPDKPQPCPWCVR